MKKLLLALLFIPGLACASADKNKKRVPQQVTGNMGTWKADMNSTDLGDVVFASGVKSRQALKFDHFMQAGFTLNPEAVQPDGKFFFTVKIACSGTAVKGNPGDKVRYNETLCHYFGD